MSKTKIGILEEEHKNNIQERRIKINLKTKDESLVENLHQNFENIDWKYVQYISNKPSVKFNKYIHLAADRESKQFKKFAEQFKTRYLSQVNYPTYCKLIATLVLLRKQKSKGKEQED